MRQIDVAIPADATVVVSVRLDRQTARRLLLLARMRRQRLSDVLRAAAEAYAPNTLTEGRAVLAEWQ